MRRRSPVAFLYIIMASALFAACRPAATERNAKLPEVPTMAEVGIPGGYTGRSYFFAFPVGTDESILRRLSDAVRRITEDPLFRQQIFEKVGMPAFFVPFDYARAYLDEMWAGMEWSLPDYVNIVKRPYPD